VEEVEEGVDTIRTLAEQRHFYTAEVDLVDYGRILMIGDETAVQHVVRLIEEHRARRGGGADDREGS
jgi:hypothetical protein